MEGRLRKKGGINERWSSSDKKKRKTRVRGQERSSNVLCSAPYSLWDYGQMTTAAKLVHCNTRASVTWFAGKGDDCFWAAGTSMHTAVSFSQARLMLPVFLIPTAVCGQRAWRPELSGPEPASLSPLPSPTRDLPGSPLLSPPPPPPPPLPRPPQPVGQQHGSSNCCSDKCFRHNVGGEPPGLPKMLTNHNTN